MSNSNPSGSATSPNNPTPSVPISVYRELAAELQATQALLDSLHAQNQKLTRHNQQLTMENQQLHLEIANVGESVRQMTQVAAAFSTGKRSAPPKEPAFKPPTIAPNLRVFWEDRVPPPPMERQPAIQKPIVEQPVRPLTIDFAPGEDEIDKKWLIAIAAIIILVAFGAGYWIVRPFLPSR